jgi:hypothetical protein
MLVRGGTDLQHFRVALHRTEPKDVGPRAGKLGVAAIILYGIFVLVATFVATYFWSDSDETLSAIVAVASIGAPVIIGFLFAETKSQRAGAIAFVVAAALLSGGAGAYAYQERDAYEERRDNRLPAVLDDTDEASAPTAPGRPHSI